ncbi:hypothetical protein L1987_83915 [Smallanthus sonchifolius]|uniref:Uncharacterized protein n=1 Tax=Smallanthus sonchifolius TaxID=185202 RepID=A0ACB8YD79_9ASTR|nr:hypothetical protein L1987_83915 [Smallanthus sonchifolius]
METELEEGEFRLNEVGVGRSESMKDEQTSGGERDTIYCNNNAPQSNTGMHGEFQDGSNGGTQDNDEEPTFNIQGNIPFDKDPSTVNVPNGPSIPEGGDSTMGSIARKRARMNFGLNEDLLDLNSPPSRPTFSFPNFVTPIRRPARRHTKIAREGRNMRSPETNNYDDTPFPIFCPTEHQADPKNLNGVSAEGEMVAEVLGTVQLGSAVGIDLVNRENQLKDAIRDEGEPIVAQ